MQVTRAGEYAVIGLLYLARQPEGRTVMIDEISDAERLEVPLLGEIPLFTEIRIAGDKGVPIVIAAPESEPARAFRKCAESVLRTLQAS